MGLFVKSTLHREASPVTIYTPQYRISRCTTHKDLWSFVDRKTNQSFALNCSEEWIRENHEIVTQHSRAHGLKRTYFRHN